MVEKAKSQVALKGKPAKLSPEQSRIQTAFTNDARLGKNEAFAELVAAITGFRPRCSSTTVVPFEVYYIGGTVNKCALCVHSLNGQVKGCMGTTEAVVTWDSSCRVATAEEGAKFIADNAEFWTDPAFMQWFGTNVGIQNLQLFLDTLNS